MNNKFVDLMDLYYFWFMYQQSNRYNLKDLQWRGERSKKQFEVMLECKLLELKLMPKHQTGTYNGQTKAEYTKNFTRVKDIMTKSDGDEEKAIRLARTQAIRITDEWKAINRAMAARDLKQEHIFDVFFFRAYELGTVSKQDYRDYQLEKLGI
jgi:hypothetical protein